MTNYLNLIFNPQIRYEKIFEVMRDRRKGGLSPEMYSEFIDSVKSLPPLHLIQPSDFLIFDKFNLSDVSEADHQNLIKEVMRRGIEESKKCWHPNEGINTCNLDENDKILISAAHSVQNNGILNRIAEDGHVMSYAFDKSEIEGSRLGRNLASIFWGFCNNHDSIFSPIETIPYDNTDEQNFLFAYRAFVVSSHKKNEVSTWINYGEQSENDILENKKIFDNAILNKNYSVIKTEVIELELFYPIAVSSSFYLDYDFNGNPIPHSEDKMEDIYITLFPTANNKTLFLLSYLEQDSHLYENLVTQLKERNNLKSDISMLIAAHTENVYFNPIYYKTFIDQHSENILKLVHETQFDFARVDENGNITNNVSLTPNNYLSNIYNINFFGY
ncbi:hypothetical protein [Chryseobacterium indoltheticum]|jgi:hypothetical protein|uniref:hypothetical protein n=1 Tax=Chryseobacterium indoltheticum TaxID=254 RepID=UPI00242DC9B8|nr:hypothetical protein [Chryseobacterium indoltheticum]MDF2831531.1 hypothetical protein [Chryseobacterium indoltheticum]